jgi:FlaA1/EpsC-like NDP-sugar epimerase
MKLYNVKSLAVFYDLLAAIISWGLAYLLRFDFDLSSYWLNDMFKVVAWFVPLQAMLFWFLGIYRTIWKYSGAPDLLRIFLVISIPPPLIILSSELLQINLNINNSILLNSCLIMFILMGGGRFIYKFWVEYSISRVNRDNLEPVFILGSGVAAMTLSKELTHSLYWKLSGFFDDDLTKRGRTINGVKVIGSLDSLPYWSERMGVRQAIIAMPSASLEVKNILIQMCKNNGIEVFSMPSLDKLLRGSEALSNLNHINLDDLLGRPPVKLDSDPLSCFLGNKTVLITGAGGSIGSELCRQVALFEPLTLVMIELNEFALYKLEQELVGLYPNLSFKFLLGDVRDFSRIDEIFITYNPDVVFHAAAYKHVPLLEIENSWQAIQNNVLGTWTVASLAQRNKVSKFVLISTDKAVNPTNVMGATKRLAEKVCQGLQKPIGLDFVVVRFGNVLGSTGSVIPKFREQIAKGGPITVTHPEITRYFMSIPEAAQLLLQAGMIGKKAEIFVLDMGESVKIVDLAKNLIRLSGLNENEIRIIFTGLRPGEKLYEELLADNEVTLPTVHPKLRIAKAQTVDDLWLKSLMIWINGTKINNEKNIKLNLAKWVPEYLPYYK